MRNLLKKKKTTNKILLPACIDGGLDFKGYAKLTETVEHYTNVSRPIILGKKKSDFEGRNTLIIITKTKKYHMLLQAENLT